MGLGETLLLYLIAGFAVAGAVYLSGDGDRGWLPLATATVFWPLYLPVLLSRPETPTKFDRATSHAAADEMAEAIAQVDAELDTAFSSLDGWAENVLAREKDRLVELRSALATQAARIREMDALMARTEIEAGGVPETVAEDGPLVVDRRALSEQARRKNLGRLREVRCRAYDDLMGTLAWIRELVSMIHLAKFTGAPASRAEELVAQIAAAVEGISAVTWQDAGEEQEERRGNTSAA
ncbi:MAG TPA: hypothetical protein VNH11_19070 [Pirellulales bacterium]|nr:hypothetical protein [Pirellulales bacterium]